MGLSVRWCDGRAAGGGRDRAGVAGPDVLVVEGPVGSHAFGGGLEVANRLALLVAILAVLAGAASMVARFRHARGIERQQLRWVALPAALTGLAMLVVAVLVAAGSLLLAGWASVLGTLFLPLATGAAVLRYRLYDLDRIVSRTLAYGLLSVLLGLGYAAVVLGLGRLLAVVDQTVQATSASLWLRPPAPAGTAGAVTRQRT